MKKLVYKTFTGLRDLQDFKDSGHEVSRRLEAGVRRLERRRNKLRNRYFKEHGSHGHFREYDHQHSRPSKCCPLCGERKRRAGYYIACPDCMPIVEWRRDITLILEQLQVRMKSEGAELRPEFLENTARINVTLKVAPDHWMSAEGEPRDIPNCLQFTACKIFSKYETDQAMMDLKKFIMCLVLNLYQNALEKAQQYVDKNGCVMLLGQYKVPAAGPWKKSITIDPVPFPFSRRSK